MTNRMLLEAWIVPLSGSGVGVTKIRHSCDWDMNFQPMQRPIAWAGTSKPLRYLFPRGEG